MPPLSFSCSEMPSAPLGAARAAPDGSVADYERVCQAVRYVSEHRLEQPSLSEIAAHIGLSPAHFQRLFQRWAGVSPKVFLQALTLDHARALLRQQASVLEAAHAVGLSGESRLHDLFLTQERMTPGTYKRGGAGLEIAYGFHPSPFGLALLMLAQQGLAGLAFVEDDAERGRVLAEMQVRWPKAHYRPDQAATGAAAACLFGAAEDKPPMVEIVLIGTDFEIRVWRHLLQVPMGQVTSYGALAKAVGRPGAARAVGRAVGHNPLAFVVPCHRVVGAGGALTGYHWGLTRKRVLLGWEAARLADARTDV